MVTDKEGYFEFPPLNEPFRIIVADEAGWAMVDDAMLATNPEIVLQPWGRVEGVVMLGKEPGAGENLSLHHGRLHETNDVSATPRITKHYNAYSGEEGRFIFPRVFPGEARISRRMWRDWLGITSHEQLVEVSGGDILHVDLGGTGRPVVGQFVLPAELKGNAVLEEGLFHLFAVPSVEDRPANWDDMRPNEQSGYERDWGLGLSGRPRLYGFPVAPDGSFRIDDVVPGSYTLFAMVFSPSEGRGFRGGNEVGRVIVRIEVPPPDEGLTDEVFEIPPIALKPRRKWTRVQVGMEAPDFLIEDLSGAETALSSFRGRFVLLHFWFSTEELPTQDLPLEFSDGSEQVPYLRAVYERFVGRSDFTMIGVNILNIRNEVRRYTDEHDIHWGQFRPHDGDHEPLIGYFPEGPPARIFLLDPDGIVLNTDLQGEEIERAVEEALRAAKEK